LNVLWNEVRPIVARVYHAQFTTGLLLLLTVVTLMIVQWHFRNRLSTEGSSRLRQVLLTIVVAVGLAHAWDFAWLGDDAFISFRYSQNFAEGHGLVFNIGEWVEGYTNFLWTFLLGVLHFFGLSIPHTALFLNLAAFVGVLLVTHRIVHHWLEIPGVLPSWSSIALAGSTPFAIYGTSGLETMPGVLCVVLGIYAALKARYRTSGLYFILGAMMRPDHILFWGSMGLAFAFDDLLSRPGHVLKRLDWRRYFQFSLALFCLYIPFFAFRWWLYGDMFPNTYYAKSGGLSYFSQGVKYLGVFLGTTGGYLWVPMWLVALWFGPRDRGALTLRIFSFFAVTIFGAYVCKVGGGFMENRFLLVLLPIAFVTIEYWVRGTLSTSRARWLVCAAGALLVAAIITRVEVVKPFQKKWHIAAEHTWYQVVQLNPLKIRSRYFGIGQKLGKMFADSAYKPPIAYPCVGMVGYYSRLPLVDTYGLVNRRVAHKVLKKRGRPGHEKRAGLEDVLAEGAVLAHDRYGRKSLKKYLEVKMAGTSLYLLENQETLKAKLRGVKGIRWPRSIQTELKRAIAREDRTRILALKSLGARLIDDQIGHKIDGALSTIDDFEDGFSGWETKSGRPVRSGANIVGRTGRYAANLVAKKKRSMTRSVTLKSDEAVSGWVAGGGSRGQYIELVGPEGQTASHYTTGRSYFEPFTLVAHGTGVHELRILSDGTKHQFLVDGMHTVSVETLVGQLTLKGSFDYPEWLRGLNRLGPDHPAMTAYREEYIHSRWSFDGGAFPMGSQVKGRAFGSKPTTRGILKQAKLTGYAYGGVINSFHGGDKTTGRITLPSFTITGPAIHLSVAGGADCKKTYVALKVGGKIRHRVCGRNDEVFRGRRISTRKFMGKEASLVVVDNSRKSWGHIMLDEVVMERGESIPEVLPEVIK
jgi:hypothetical protein